MSDTHHVLITEWREATWGQRYRWMLLLMAMFAFVITAVPAFIGEFQKVLLV